MTKDRVKCEILRRFAPQDDKPEIPHFVRDDKPEIPRDARDDKKHAPQDDNPKTPSGLLHQ